MGALKIALTVIFIIVCVALVVLVLMQEGKSAGLGTIGGAAETYWGKNKSRSMEGLLVKITKVLAFGFILLALLLNLNIY
ncbi:MAG: preprotein translocase subunit SecG [Lachnospiraceae bacterium]|nr:preprotein translocase subunit SecG [Lachnospiraceae bacterium]